MQTPALAPRRGQRRVLAAAAHGVHGFIGRHGVDPQEVLSRAGFEPTMLVDPRLALDLPAYVDMMEFAAATTGNDNFGLHFGHQFKPEMLGLIGEICVTSSDLGTAIANLAELFPYHQQSTETRLVFGPDLIRLEYRILDGSVLERRQDAELTIGMFINVFRHCLGPYWSPEEVHCEHPRPEHWREHEHLYDAPFCFSQPTNAILFRNEKLSRAMPGADQSRLWALRHEITRLEGGVGAVPLIDRIRCEIRSRLATTVVGVADVAEALALPRWTLQRRLDDVGFNFSSLVDDVRRELALTYIRLPQLAISDIAFALGYSELSALSRAFRRWYGVSPQVLRSSCTVRSPE